MDDLRSVANILQRRRRKWYFLVCARCGGGANPPYDVGDTCLCGGRYKRLNRAQAVLDNLRHPPMSSLGDSFACLTIEDLNHLLRYIDVLERQARKASNQRKTLRALNRRHKALVDNARWMRSVMRGVKRRIGRDTIIDVEKETQGLAKTEHEEMAEEISTFTVGPRD